jgi:hypothetical protein
LGKVSIQVFPGKGKEEVRVQMEGDSEKGILEIEDRKVSSIRGDIGEDCVRIWDQWVDGGIIASFIIFRSWINL